MIGTLPVSQLAPTEYRIALDAAMTLIGTEAPVAVICGEPALEGEVRQRLPVWVTGSAAAGLWVEPDRERWRADLAKLAVGLAPGATLALILSLPLARLLPERRGWSGRPLGTSPAGLPTLWATLGSAGMRPTALHGFHTPQSVALGAVAGWLERRGRTDLADRLGFAARLRYRSAGPLARLSTVALVVCAAEGAPHA